MWQNRPEKVTYTACQRSFEDTVRTGLCVDVWYGSQPCFEELVQFMSSGPCHVLVVSRQEGSDDVIPAWREFIGPADTEEARRNKPER